MLITKFTPRGICWYQISRQSIQYFISLKVRNINLLVAHEKKSGDHQNHDHSVLEPWKSVKSVMAITLQHVRDNIPASLDPHGMLSEPMDPQCAGCWRPELLLSECEWWIRWGQRASLVRQLYLSGNKLNMQMYIKTAPSYNSVAPSKD